MASNLNSPALACLPSAGIREAPPLAALFSSWYTTQRGVMKWLYKDGVNVTLKVTLQVLSSRNDSICNSKQLASAMRQMAGEHQTTGSKVAALRADCSHWTPAPTQRGLKQLCHFLAFHSSASSLPNTGPIYKWLTRTWKSSGARYLKVK